MFWPAAETGGVPGELSRRVHGPIQPSHEIEDPSQLGVGQLDGHNALVPRWKCLCSWDHMAALCASPGGRGAPNSTSHRAFTEPK